MVVGPWTAISPVMPVGNSMDSSSRFRAASLIGMIATRLGGTGRPTQIPAPPAVKPSTPESISAEDNTATGRHSVAPYGV